MLLYDRQHSRVDCDVTMHCWALRNFWTNEIVYEPCAIGHGGRIKTLIYDGVKLERGGDWIEPALNKHTPLSPTQPIVCLPHCNFAAKKNYS